MVLAAQRDDGLPSVPDAHARPHPQLEPDGAATSPTSPPAGHCWCWWQEVLNLNACREILVQNVAPTDAEPPLRKQQAALGQPEERR